MLIINTLSFDAMFQLHTKCYKKKKKKALVTPCMAQVPLYLYKIWCIS